MVERGSEAGAATSPAPESRTLYFNRWSALLAGLAFAVACLWSTGETFPHALRLSLTFPQGRPGHVEPILTTGRTGDGDFLGLKYETETRAVLVYDSWGAGGPTSAAFNFQPGSTHGLEIEIPSLNGLAGVATETKGPLRVTLDGTLLSEGPVNFHPRHPAHVYFGRNPIGGNTEPLFHGTLRLPDGRLLSGGPDAYFSRFSRLTAFFRNRTQLLASLVFGVLAGLLVPQPQRLRSILPRAKAALRPPHRTFVVIACFGLLVFAWFVTDGTFQFVFSESFGDFYDYQAASLLQGRLDVPEPALSGEAFVFDGKVYGYFGPTPALLRIPLVVMGVGFGQVSRCFLLLDYAIALLGLYAVLIQAVRMRHGPSALPSSWATSVFVGAAGLGSTLLFLSSRAYIYHEAILCGAATAIWAAYCGLRYLENPRSRWCWGAIILGILSVHARPPIGLFALVFVGSTAALQLSRSFRQADPRPLRHLAIGGLCVLGVLSFNAVSYLKFHTIEGCPLRYNVQYTPKRLARIDGKQFHLVNFRFGIDAYVLKPSLKVSPHFPYFQSTGPDWRNYPDVKLDVAESMAGVPYAMPALVAFALITLPFIASSSRLWRDSVLAAWAAIIPTAFAMFTAIAVSHRYTGDFVPFLIVAGALGVATIDHNGFWFARLVRHVFALLCLASVAITLGLTLRYEGQEVWGVPDTAVQCYHQLCVRVDQFLGVK